MQPATLHYTLSIENAIVYNWSYYASSTITRSVFAIMQEVVLTWGCDYPINIGAKSCLHQMIMMWLLITVRENKQVINLHVDAFLYLTCV